MWDFQLSDPSQAKTFLITLTFLTLAIIVIKGLVHFGKEYLLWKVTHRLLWRIKVQLFNRVIRFPVSFFDQERSGEVLSRATYDVIQLENALRVGSQVMKSVIYALIYLIMMIIISPVLTLLALMVFPISALVIRQFSRKMSRAAQKLSRNVADYTSFLEEAVGGSRVIKAFNLEERLSSRFKVKMDENYKWGMKGAKYATINSPAQEIIATVGVVILVLFCGLRMLSGEMTIGDFSGFLVL
ncbi:MAG: ABC transporter transmembrane domain-containing protein, partial [bacterium]